MADKQAVKQVDIGKGKDKEKRVKHYSSKHHILLVGEGDFSFSWCLARSFGSGSKIVASSLDSYDDVIQKYKNAKSNLESLKELGACTLHGVDATKMKHHLPLRMQKFDRIIFNFPHAGFYLKEDNNIMIDMHKELVEKFFENANDMLQANGEIHVTHKTSPPFCHWNILGLARRNYLGFIGRDDFKIEDYPGYRNKRGEGDRCDMHFPLGECGTFKFTSSHTLKRSQQLQGNPMGKRKHQKITFDQRIPTNFIMNSKYFSDHRLTPLAVDFMEGTSHSFGTCSRGLTHWSNSVNEVPMSEFGRHMALHYTVMNEHGLVYRFQPDITAPGVSVIAAFTLATGPNDAAYDKRRIAFNTESGTSMSCPHVSGIVGLLKSLHPDWTPAAIRSAIMTTATTRDNNGDPILDSPNTRATPFAYGAGHVQPNRAADPGLVYDLTANDFLNYLCSRGYTAKDLKLFTDKPYNCPESFSLTYFNYPSISVVNLNDTITVTRRVKNVGSPGKYYIHLREPTRVLVSVEPGNLEFKKH